MKIVNSQGETVTSYAYDVSGKLLYIKNYYNALVTDPNHIGMLNPLRYRGYVYDDETGLYYLQSRYYDPVTTRFINADVYCDTNSGSPLSTNMYAYCENNALRYADFTGENYDYIGNHFYKVTNQGCFNCYAYALGYRYSIMKPGTRGYDVERLKNIKQDSYQWSMLSYKMFFFMGNSYSIDTAYREVKNDLKSMNIPFRCSNKNTKLKKGEYRIAMRVMNYHLDDGKGTRYVKCDFHFAKQDPKTGFWWQKIGKEYIQNLGKVNMDETKNWKVNDTFKSRNVRLPYYTQATVYNGYVGKYIKLFYNSSTKYLIISKKFWRLTYDD